MKQKNTWRLEDKATEEFFDYQRKTSQSSFLKKVLAFAGVAYVSLFGVNLAEDLVAETIERRQQLKSFQTQVQDYVPIINHIHTDSLPKEGSGNLLDIINLYSQQGFLVRKSEEADVERIVVVGNTQHNNTEDIDPFFRAIRGEEEWITLKGFENSKDEYTKKIPYEILNDTTIRFSDEDVTVTLSEVNPFTLKFDYELLPDEDIKRVAYVTRGAEYTIKQGAEPKIENFHFVVHNISYPIELSQRKTFEDLLRELVFEEVKLSLKSQRGMPDDEAEVKTKNVYLQYFDTREELERFFAAPEEIRQRIDNGKVSEEEMLIYDATKNTFTTAPHVYFLLFSGMGKETFISNKEFMNAIETNGYMNVLPVLGPWMNRQARKLGEKYDVPVVSNPDEHVSYKKLGFLIAIPDQSLDFDNLGWSIKESIYANNFLSFEGNPDAIKKLWTASFGFLDSIMFKKHVR
ncbi:MAG TPA: hypothetical protein ENN46_01925 [Candidatus Woesearchaeota archaeon]|nr:hypothetical protein [Candidatus Woesearchaeota archaeon]